MNTYQLKNFQLDFMAIIKDEYLLIYYQLSSEKLNKPTHNRDQNLSSTWILSKMLKSFKFMILLNMVNNP